MTLVIALAAMLGASGGAGCSPGGIRISSTIIVESAAPIERLLVLADIKSPALAALCAELDDLSSRRLDRRLLEVAIKVFVDIVLVAVESLVLAIFGGFVIFDIFDREL